MAPSSGFFARLRTRLSPLVPRTPATVAWLATTLLETAVDTLIVGLTLNVYAEKLWRTVLERDESSVLPVYLGLVSLASLPVRFSASHPAPAHQSRPCGSSSSRM